MSVSPRKRSGHSHRKNGISVPPPITPTPEDLYDEVRVNALPEFHANISDTFKRYMETDEYTDGTTCDEIINGPSSVQYDAFMDYCKSESSGENLECYTKFNQLPKFDYNSFVRGLHEIVSNEENFTSMNIAGDHQKKLRKLDAVYWNIGSNVPWDLKRIHEIKETPDDVIKVVTKCLAATRAHMEETFHRFSITNPEITKNDDVIERGTITAKYDETHAQARKRVMANRLAFIKHLQQEHIIHYMGCYSKLQKMISVQWNYVTCMAYFRITYESYFSKTYQKSAPTKKKPVTALNPDWINLPRKTVAEMTGIYGKYFALGKLIPLKLSKTPKISKRKSATLPKTKKKRIVAGKEIKKKKERSGSVS